eukprot:TRINITY_DN8308_c0_g1_i1.p1 TRINITY_DN8308_c0_g1~~TRINITY_DN8308_c0_g1_i1.p1  ORF type:complete len:122 (+),score=11.71 TRINITY_DN8308_c0_g1_i1:106-471(+)
MKKLIENEICLALQDKLEGAQLDELLQTTQLYLKSFSLQNSSNSILSLTNDQFFREHIMRRIFQALKYSSANGKQLYALGNHMAITGYVPTVEQIQNLLTAFKIVELQDSQQYLNLSLIHI